MGGIADVNANVIGEKHAMASDREIARRSLDMQARARDYALSEHPGYCEWSKARQAQGIPQEILMISPAMAAEA